MPRRPDPAEYWPSFRSPAGSRKWPGVGSALPDCRAPMRTPAPRRGTRGNRPSDAPCASGRTDRDPGRSKEPEWTDSDASWLPLFHILAQFIARVGDVRPDGGLGTIQPLRYFFGRQTLYVAQHQSGAFARGQQAQAVFQIAALLGAQQNILRTLVVAFRRGVQLAIGHPPAAPQEIDGRIRRYARKPMRRFMLVLKLLLPLQRLDKGLLGQVLGIGHVANDAVNLHENSA